MTGFLQSLLFLLFQLKKIVRYLCDQFEVSGNFKTFASVGIYLLDLLNKEYKQFLFKLYLLGPLKYCLNDTHSSLN